MDTHKSLAEELEGRLLKSTWKVGKRIENDEKYNTGGNFSVCYHARNIKTKSDVFIKVLDIHKLFKVEEISIDTINQQTGFFIYERNILLKCKNKKMDRIVRALDFGEIFDDKYKIPKVNYIVFELADNPLRKIILISKKLDYAWAIRSMHNLAVGIQQLHKNDIAHQDLKPSNILLFKDEGTKIGDMGRTVSFDYDLPSPFNLFEFSGDKSYAPLDILYGYKDTESKRQKYGADLYMLGSLMYFYFKSVSINEAIRRRIQEEHWFIKWGGTYSEVIPYLRNALCELIESLHVSIEINNEAFRDEVCNIILRLCEPDIEKRCYSKSTISLPLHDLEYLISRLNHRARELEFSILN